ncbi:MAG TPA: glycosyltransferase family 39 protein [Gemmataceae bacterium]|nr:glycosyltransferase family 39 protein [Gemmataceae bacterium]
MTEMRRFTLVDGLLLIAIVALAAGTRAGYLISCADYARNAGPLLVETPPAELEKLVSNLKDKQSFASRAPFATEEKETAQVAPGYPWLVSAVARVVDPAARDSTMRWLQCALGALTAGLYFLFARRAFRSRAVATLTGLFCAAHPFWILDTAALADGVAATFLLALSLLLGLRASQTSGPLTSLLFGLSLAALALVRAAFLPFAFVALAWFLWRSRGLTRGWLCALLAFLGFVNGLAPWTFRNWQLYGEPVPIVDSAYYHLWIGNNPHATGGPVSEQAMRDAPVEELSQIPRSTDRYARLSGLIGQEMHDHPVETVRRRLRAGLDFVFGERWFIEGRLADRAGSEESMPTWLAWSYPVVLESTLLGLVVLALLGWRWTYGWRSSALPASLAVFWIPLPYVLSHAEALSGPRLPLDGVLLCYAAFALACLLPVRGYLWAGESEADGR